MDKLHLESSFTSEQWTKLINKYALTKEQEYQLKLYLELLIEWNEKFNLTAITDATAIGEYHFDDSLALSQHIDFSGIKTVADVGTGGGFPGLPLKILFPHLTVILIEVNSKKRSFLTHVIEQLGLTNIILYPYDWRTFLRTIPTEWGLIDYFFARASLQPEELTRVFKSACAYKNATFIYWASSQWFAEKIVAPFVEKEILYTLSSVERKFVFLKKLSSPAHSERAQ
jgi:16S rRNA (guanine(527)-N(7))-methyltransferase RsmG